MDWNVCQLLLCWALEYFHRALFRGSESGDRLSPVASPSKVRELGFALFNSCFLSVGRMMLYAFPFYVLKVVRRQSDFSPFPRPPPTQPTAQLPQLFIWRHWALCSVSVSLPLAEVTPTTRTRKRMKPVVQQSRVAWNDYVQQSSRSAFA